VEGRENATVSQSRCSFGGVLKPRSRCEGSQNLTEDKSSGPGKKRKRKGSSTGRQRGEIPGREKTIRRQYKRVSPKEFKLGAKLGNCVRHSHSMGEDVTGRGEIGSPLRVRNRDGDKRKGFNTRARAGPEKGGK